LGRSLRQQLCGQVYAVLLSLGSGFVPRCTLLGAIDCDKWHVCIIHVAMVSRMCLILSRLC
jgi:hypothetical protein